MTVCTLASSSSGNCTVVSHGKTHVLIDAGISMRRIKVGLQHFGLTPDDLTCVLVTHEHSDHISGIAMLVKYFKTPIFTSSGTGNMICGIMPYVNPYMNCFEAGTELELGEIIVRGFRTPHDSTESLGYRLLAGGNTLVYVTDLGCVTDEVVDATRGADIAVIEANHDREMLRSGPYPAYLKRRILSAHGHLENSDSGIFAARLAVSGARFIQLSHLSRENNTPRLAYETVERILSEKGVAVGKDAELDVAPPYTMGRVYRL